MRHQCLRCCLLSGYNFMRLPPCSNKPKLVILDECDAMTKDAQFALRRGGFPVLLCSELPLHVSIAASRCSQASLLVLVASDGTPHHW